MAGPLSLLLTLYTRSGDTVGQTTTLTFPLRNLTGDLPAQVEQARPLMEAVAADLHALSGFGVDQARLRQGSTTLAQQSFPTLVPQAAQRYFEHAALWRFPAPLATRWVRGREQSFLPPAEPTGWTAQTTPTRAVSFSLPVVVAESRDHVLPGYVPFFQRGRKLYRGRKSTSYGLTLLFDHADLRFQRFFQRFTEPGHLAVGRREAGFLPAEATMDWLELEGRWWSRPKEAARPRAAPRLASQPRDETAYLYLIQQGRQALFKIGISGDPAARLADLQSANPARLHLRHQVPADNARAAEWALHQALQEQRRRGEWFGLSPAQQEALCSVREYREGGFHTATGILTAEALLAEAGREEERG